MSNMTEAQRQLAEAKLAVMLAEHTPLTEDEWVAAEKAADASVEGYQSIASLLMGHAAEASNAVTDYLMALCNENRRILAEAHYWRERALRAETTDD